MKQEICFQLYVNRVPYGTVWLTPNEVKTTLRRTGLGLYTLASNPLAIYRKVS